MAKFSVVGDETASEATHRIYKQILDVKHLRFVPNFFKTLATSPDVLEGTWSVYRSVSTRGSISGVPTDWSIERTSFRSLPPVE